MKLADPINKEIIIEAYNGLGDTAEFGFEFYVDEDTEN